MRSLIIYPNCSKGGVSTVIRGRARSDSESQIDAIFFNDRGGSNAFADLENIDIRIVRADRVETYLKAVVRESNYDEISVLSHPSTANLLTSIGCESVYYEFHSSDMSVVAREIDDLDLEGLAGVLVPSEFMRRGISRLVGPEFQALISVRPNLVDSTIFAPNGSADFFDSSSYKVDESSLPLVWIGRFDKGKGYQYFLRTLSQLPHRYIAHVVISLESDPARADRLLLEAAELSVSDRIRIYSNLTQVDMGNLLRSSRDRGGCLVSTSLMESFGYAFAESLACGLRVAAFDIPVIEMFRKDYGDLVSSARIGSVSELSERILEQTHFKV